MGFKVYIWIFIFYTSKVNKFLDLFYFKLRRNFGLYIFIGITILYYTGMTCLSALKLDGERLSQFIAN